jgi:hypothetical protein
VAIHRHGDICSVLVEATLSTATTPRESEAVINGPLPTLVGSLVDDEWQQWEERMSGWPIPVRAKLRAARRPMSAPPQSGYGVSAGILPNSGTAPTILQI